MANAKFSKICETLWMTWAFFVVGINYSVLGPTLLDLQLFLKQDLETLSTIPLSSGFGETTGMFVTMWLSKLGHKRLQLSISLLLSSIIMSIIPITNSYIFVDVMFFLVGFISAVPSCFLMDVCSELWKDKGTTFQFILVGSSLGAILTPLIVEPFLCKGGEAVLPGSNYTKSNSSQNELQTVNDQCSVNNLLIIQEWCADIENIVTRTGDYTDIQNVINNTDISSPCVCATLSASVLQNLQIKSTNWERACENITTNQIYVIGRYTDEQGPDILWPSCCLLMDTGYQCAVTYGDAANSTAQCTEEDSNVRTAYVVLAFVLLPTSFAFFYYWWRRDSNWATDAITESQRQDHVEFDMPKQGLLQGGIFYTLLFLSFFPVTALTIVFATYLTAFGVQGPLQLTKSTMVFMTSVFWLSTLIGRIISTAVTPCLGNFTVITGNFAGLVVSAILLVFFAPNNAHLLWAGTVLLGLFACPYEGAGVAWAAKYVGMSSNLVLISWISVSFGNLAFPFIGGIMFENIGPHAFLYLLAGMIAFIVLMFFLLNISVRFLK